MSPTTVAIARWKADATAKYHYSSEPLSLESEGHETVVTARVARLEIVA